MTDKKLWFRVKRFGLGWYPTSWEGWMVIFVYVALLLKGILLIDPHKEITLFTAYVFIITALLLLVCYVKGEKPRWRWDK